MVQDDNGGFQPRGFHVTFVAPVAGAYCIRVKNPSGNTGTYSIALQQAAGSTATFWERYP